MNETIDRPGLREALRWSFVLCGTDRGESRESQEGWDFCIVTRPPLSAWVNLSLFERPFSSVGSKGNGEATTAYITCNREGNNAMTWSELSNNEMRPGDKETASQLTDLMAWCVWGIFNLNKLNCEAIWRRLIKMVTHYCVMHIKPFLDYKLKILNKLKWWTNMKNTGLW